MLHRLSCALGVASAVAIVTGIVAAANAAPMVTTTGPECWIDSATGAYVPTWPKGASPNQISLDPSANQYSNPASGRNFARQPDGSWIDSATGQQVGTWPLGASPKQISFDPSAVQYSNPASGRNFARVPCPPTSTASSTVGGLYIGGELVKNWGHVRSTERLAATDVITNQFSDSADPFGGGFLIGYKFAPWANNVIVSPFASFDFLHAPVNHTFPGGSFLGTTANFMGTGGVKIGPQLDMGLWLYGIAGVSVLNETLNINFIPVASSQSATVAGATVGVGGAWQPAFLQGFGLPVSLFLEYQHTWWQEATFNTPAASPLFNYSFRREDDVVKFGFTVALSPPSARPANSPMFVKAPAK